MEYIGNSNFNDPMFDGPRTCLCGVAMNGRARKHVEARWRSSSSHLIHGTWCGQPSTAFTAALIAIATIH